MLIVQDDEVVTFFYNFNWHSDDLVFFFFFLVLSFSSLISARILWSIFINCDALPQKVHKVAGSEWRYTP